MEVRCFDNDRLKNEELVARMIAMVKSKMPLDAQAGDKDLDDYMQMIVSQKNIKKIGRKNDSIFNFIIKMANARGIFYGSADANTKRTKVGKKEFSLWLRIYFYCAEKFGEKFIVEDYEKLWKDINKIYQE